MLFKVMTLTFITICAADKQKLPSEPKSEQKLPLRRFSRHVISPMNYGDTKVDDYSTPSSILRTHRSAFPNVFRKLQYAPLRINIAPQNKNAGAESNTVTPTPTIGSAEPTEIYLDKKSRLSFGKSHLEPREMVPDKKCYASDLTSVSRSPGHNAVYRTVAEPVQKKTPLKIYDYIRPSGINLNLETLTTTFTPLIDLGAKMPDVLDIPLSLTKPNRHFVINPIKTVIPVQTKSKRQYSPLTKYHRLHLNIARVYSPGQVQGPKPPAFAPSYSGNFDNLAIHAYPDLSQENVVYPVKHHHVGYHLSFT